MAEPSADMKAAHPYRVDGLLAELDRTTTPASTIVGALVGTAIPIAACTGIAIFVAYVSRGFANGIAALLLLGFLATLVILSIAWRRAASGRLPVSARAIRLWLFVQVMRCLLYAAAMVILYVGLFRSG